MDETLPMEWRGRIRVLLYGMDLRSRADADDLTRSVNRILKRQRFGDDPEEFYDAVVAALRSGRVLAEDGQDEGAVRSALTGIVERFDARRPWPPAPFVEQDVQLWDELRAAPVVGVVQRGISKVGLAFGLHARPVTVGADRLDVLVVRMLSGRLVGMRASGVWGAPTVDVLSPADPEAVRAEIAEATGLVVDPP
ncbi:hypothetical protein [Pseudonocardia lacus]|uniref:hypothetical protein n=1 Tax=Pseudonocardia lacus TaxID=2835865 RepID=UPI001BDC95D0|nr:hypothetical protein [Pseudonocardia lacus]